MIGAQAARMNEGYLTALTSSLTTSMSPLFESAVVNLTNDAITYGSRCGSLAILSAVCFRWAEHDRLRSNRGSNLRDEQITGHILCFNLRVSIPTMKHYTGSSLWEACARIHNSTIVHHSEHVVGRPSERAMTTGSSWIIAHSHLFLAIISDA